jgi:general stress protein 26
MSGRHPAVLTVEDLVGFLQSQRIAVQSSLSADGAPQAAVVGIAVTDDLNVVFDTDGTSRKVANLRHDPRIALVIGGMEPGDERTVQYEGLADEPSGVDLERLTEIYYLTYPDGRERRSWPGLVYIRVRPTWVRYSDFNENPPLVMEFDESALGGPTGTR